MILPKVGDAYPMSGPHARHSARVAAIDTHGVPSFDDIPWAPPTILIECDCGARWLDALPEAVAVGRPVLD